MLFSTSNTLNMPKTKSNRCGWTGDNPLMIEYHDTEWGVPSYDDNHLFEMLTLEGAQAGLSWQIILNKRQGYRKLFKEFDPAKVARFNSRSVERLMQDKSIVRNRLKIESTIDNAKAIIKLQKEMSLSDFVWTFVDHKTLRRAVKGFRELPSETDASKAMSKALKKRGFRFVGPTVCYAFMQAASLTNDHEVSCNSRGK
jgi:DNA-3-methyladenine glycosylase I